MQIITNVINCIILSIVKNNERHCKGKEDNMKGKGRVERKEKAFIHIST